MNRLYLSLSFAAFVSTLACSASAEILKWVDEKGKVHYGDRVPPEYQQRSEVIENPEPVIVAPEPEIRQQNSAMVSEYKREAAIQDERRKKEAQSFAPQKGDQGLSRQDCRNRYKNKVKARTDCFRAVASGAANNK